MRGPASPLLLRSCSRGELSPSFLAKPPRRPHECHRAHQQGLEDGGIEIRGGRLVGMVGEGSRAGGTQGRDQG